MQRDSLINNRNEIWNNIRTVPKNQITNKNKCNVTVNLKNHIEDNSPVQGKPKAILSIKIRCGENRNKADYSEKEIYGKDKIPIKWIRDKTVHKIIQENISGQIIKSLVRISKWSNLSKLSEQFTRPMELYILGEIKGRQEGNGYVSPVDRHWR